MRRLLTSLPKFVLAATALILLLAAVVLRQGSGATYESRDAFAAQVEGGERTLSTATIAREWRSEIAAQRMTARRDLGLSQLLLATGILALVAFAVSLRPIPATPSVPTRVTPVPART
jgi:CO/xanthine dehydrogenase Mo-binding subunit